MSRFNPDGPFDAGETDDFERREDLESCELTAIPGIDDAEAEALDGNGISKCTVLLGHMLILNNGARNCQEVCDQMMAWLLEKGVGRPEGNKAVYAIALHLMKRHYFTYDI
jgi:hypothetical protein